MKDYFYYNSIRKTIVQFLDVFKEVQIARHNSAGDVTGYIKVPLKFGLREKVWYWLNQRKDDEMLPMMSVIMDSVEYAAQRQTSKIRNVVKLKTPPTSEYSKFLNPIPYNLGFTLTIWSLYMVDVDQILEQILPYFMPNIFIRIDIPELDANLDVKVIFTGCTPDVTNEMSDEEIRILKWNLTFDVQTYLFQPVKEVGMIKKVIDKFYLDKTSWAHRSTESEYTSGASGYEAESLFTKAIYPYFDEDAWVADTSYDIGDKAIPTTSNGYLYEVVSVTLPGKSGSTEPTWTSLENKPIVDNDIVWQRYEHDEFLRLVQYEIFGNN